ncbi:MAG TPA: DUF3037 domain-containing protein [Kineosporiaceae bacterium]|nr:DUF3037 domain-containing protein [Kineosporiaceae bacterium]
MTPGVVGMTPSLVPFEYALLRAVPRVDRGECINVGVIVYCQARDFVGARVHVDQARLRALDAGVDLELVETALHGVVAVCDGGDDAGQPARRRPRERFGWLTAPRSTVVQPGPVHSGLTADPVAELERLLTALVRQP